MKSSVCLLLPFGLDSVLAISRRHDATRWGLPGGKVDPGETNLQALCDPAISPFALYNQGAFAAWAQFTRAR